jgi:hypothetical protein
MSAKALQCILKYNETLFAQKNLLVVFNQFKGTDYCSETEEFPYLEESYEKKIWSRIVHLKAMSEQKDVLLKIGLEGLVFSVCDKLLWNISVGNDVWTEVPKNYVKHWLRNELRDERSVFREAYCNVCKNTEIGDCCVAYLRLKCICEHKSLFLDRKKRDLYIQLNLLCENVLFYLFYQVVFNACNSLLSFIKSKKKTVSSNLDGTNLDKLKDLSESICCDPVFGTDIVVEYKCADLKVDEEDKDPLWPLKIFKKLSSVIGMFTEPLFDDSLLEELLERVKEKECCIKNIPETHNKFRDLFKYEIIKSIQHDASTDAFSRTDPVFDESILTVETLSYIEELLTSPDKTLVQKIKSIKESCDRKSVFKSKRLILKKSNKKNRKSNLKSKRKSKHKSNLKSKRKSARKL